MNKIVSVLLSWISTGYDRIYGFWKDVIVKKHMGYTMVLIYVLYLGIIELKLRGFLPAWLSEKVADTHFNAVYVAFSLLLVFEVIDLIFGLTESVSRAFGKQLEIFSIILIRNGFKQFESAGEPISWDGVSQIIFMIISDAFGAIIIIFLLAAYYRQLRRNPITDPTDKQFSFINIKKAISLGMFFVFIFVGIESIFSYISNGAIIPFFPFFFTILILCDILMVLVSLHYASSFPIVFRNSGFAVATVILRVALTAPAYYNSGLGIVAAVYAIGVTVAYNFFIQQTSRD